MAALISDPISVLKLKLDKFKAKTDLPHIYITNEVGILKNEIEIEANKLLAKTKANKPKTKTSAQLMEAQVTQIKFK